MTTVTEPTSAAAADRVPAPRGRPSHTRRRHGFGFWAVAFAFLAVMAFATVPAPLYVVYQARDGFPTFTTTVVFAAYGVGVVVSLFLAGHLSDVHGRRPLVLVSIALELVAAVLFLLWNDVAGLVVARLVTGLGVGLLTATATAHLGELRVRATGSDAAAKGASVAAGAVNLGGLSLGALVGGALAEFVARPLVVPYVVFVVALAVAFVLVLAAPETVDRPTAPVPYRPQRMQAPDGEGAAFWAAGTAAFAALAVQGLFTSVAPTFLGTTFHVTDRLAAGATTFGVFAASALSQIVFARLTQRAQIRLGLVLLVGGLAVLAVAAVLLQVAGFIGGGVVAGAGVGLLFRAAIGSAGALVGPERRGGVLAATFLIAYAGLTVPVVAVGAALLVVPTLPVLIGYVVFVAVLAVVAGVRLAARA
ncbi:MULTISPECIES: MFS transporter [unclassified Curtobacterium]|uniref:MFS transporter n=1 Tax=unclassified Curtobacterium TaxID=257496 RepID=UPI0008DE3B21|nr:MULTISPECIES: MFS transporter [unclassified Curtobacterium]OIH96461.1 MFS transporter [Curtobacterium sp. MCBA15_003]OII13834.1 MFS transporter [Curtobacterium sp. MCBA15_009]OII33633.1 MFS transporter [Curtobacterium sp. MMLR14_006]